MAENEESNLKWFFSVLDVIGAINQQDDYAKTRNYWKYLKNKLKKEQPELVSATNQLKLLASDANDTIPILWTQQALQRLQEQFRTRRLLRSLTG